ncbi:MAG: hypothetical protein D6788_11000, partial [Planctomycetota bacterium]
MLTTFGYDLTGGILVILATARTDQVAWRFLRLTGFLVLALSCGLTTWNVLHPPTASSASHTIMVIAGILSGGCGAALALLAPWSDRHPSAYRMLTLLGGWAGVGAGILHESAALRTGPVPLGILLPVLIVSHAAAALLTGSITVTWLLGHAYLTATRMTIAPLRHFTRLVAWSLTLRAILLPILLLLGWWIAGRAGGTDPTPFTTPGLTAALVNDW